MTSPPGGFPPGDPTAPGPYQGPPPTYGPPSSMPPPAYQPQPPPPAYGYNDPPPAYGSGYVPTGYPYARSGYRPPPAPPGMVLIPGVAPMRAATPGQRILGRLIDTIGYLIVLGGGIAGIVAIVAHSDSNGFSYHYEYGYPSTSSGDLSFLWIYPILGGVWLVIVAYEWLTIGLTGSTLGDRLMGVRFVNTKDGGRPGLGRSLGRAVLLGGSNVVCYGLVFLLLLFSMFFDSGTGRYQGWLDKLFGLQAVTTRA